MAANRWKRRAEYLERELTRIAGDRVRLANLEQDYAQQLAAARSKADMWRRRADKHRAETADAEAMEAITLLRPDGES